MRIAPFAAGLLLASSAAQPGEPTLDQLLATPSPVEIAGKWKAVCLDHLGDVKAQRKAVKDLAIDWPYQAMFDERRELSSCMIVSTTEPGTKIEALFDAAAKAADPVALTPAEQGAQRRTATFESGGQKYYVATSLKDSPGTLIAVFVLAQVKKAD